MKKWGLLFLLFCSYAFTNCATGQNISNEGTDFWAVFPTHDPSGSQLAKIRLYITSKSSSEVSVFVGNTRILTQSVQPNVAVPIDVPRNAAYINAVEGNTLLPGRGIHIVVTEGMPKVAVYAHIYAGFRSAATLILPVESLGQNYYSMNYTQSQNTNSTNKNFIVLAATEDNTRLLIHIKGSSQKISIYLPKAGDIYEYLPNGLEDLTGTFVEIDKAYTNNCDKRFAMFSGSTSVRIGGACARSLDPLYQQLYPTTSWGKTYGVIPFIGRYYGLRIVAEQDGTIVNFNNQSITLNKGDFYNTDEFLSTPMFVKANKNVSVAQYALSQDCGNVFGTPLGDPDMVILNPIEFNIKSVTLFSSGLERISEKFLNVFIKTAAAKSFRIDGRAVAGWQQMPSDPEYSYIQFQVIDSTFKITANDGFNAMAYGFGPTESYAYSAGTNLAANNSLLINNATTKIDAPNACVNQESSFKITLDYKAINIKWKLDDLPARDYTPVPIEVPTSRGKSYLYEYDQKFTFTEIKKHQMVVNVLKPDDGNCFSGAIDYEFSFDVYPLPIAKFIVDTNPCPDTDIQFMDNNSNSQIPEKPVNKWLWDFGDGGTSTEQNPVHVYNKSGVFKLKYFAGVDDGCLSDVLEQTITVKPKMTPKFTVSQTGCVNTPLIFTNNSKIEAGSIQEYHWDFGDGEISLLTNPTHLYKTFGTFIVKMYTVSNLACKSLVFLDTIIVNKTPLPNFKLPDACIDDKAVFQNISTDADSSSGPLTYLWDFGDSTVPTASNRSTEINGSHQYNTVGTYTVILTATNVNGCSFVKEQVFTVNGSVITPKLIVKNEGNLCSNQEIVVINSSTVNSGKITRLEFYMGADGAPTGIPDIIDTSPNITKEYSTYKYPAFVSTTTRTFTIRMIAYSGTECFAQITKTITVKPSPAVVFDAVSAICFNAGLTKITQARETLGVAGVGQFSGKGITSDGLFDPALAGVGTHQITYTFSGQNACSESITQNVVVYPSPTVNLDKEIFILIGGQKKVEATATGNGLTYKWTPALGLDRDDILNPTMQGDDDRLYTLTATSDQGCSTTQTIMLNILRVVKPYSAFSPNGDTINDTWGIKYIDSYPDVEVEIFNRYGQKVFYSRGYKTPFDGNFNNQQLPVGVYYYIINPNIGTRKITGSLTIIR
ncbi:PKD domain-containing protein [Pedobacter sp. JCM 36344]|uniref:PKD domain-containing protein n=1 Tax=Pedobacter sp. JCM 36344 TaxID=3374280 RepID=UPI003977E530